MKKLTLLVIMIASLAMTNELYAQGNSGKDKPERDKPEKEKDRDKSKNEQPEKGYSEKSQSSIQNQKAVNAQRNWGHLKKGLKDEEGKYNKDELKKNFWFGGAQQTDRRLYRQGDKGGYQG